jgi:hypothetical protein
LRAELAEQDARIGALGDALSGLARLCGGEEVSR